MPTLVNRNHGSLFSAAMDLVKSTGREFENDPGVHIGHISVYYDGHMIVLSGFRGYKVKMFFFSNILFPKQVLHCGSNVSLNGLTY